MDESQWTWEEIAECRARAPGQVVFRSFVSETVLLNIQTGHYYGMDEIGARFFEVLCDSPDVESAVGVLVEEFEAPPERLREDMVRFCEELASLGLLELDEASNSKRA